MAMLRWGSLAWPYRLFRYSPNCRGPLLMLTFRRVSEASGEASRCLLLNLL